MSSREKKKLVSKARANPKATTPPPTCSSSNDSSKEDSVSSEDNSVFEECDTSYKVDDKETRKCWVGCDT